jgi:hypothetical protein
VPAATSHSSDEITQAVIEQASPSYVELDQNRAITAPQPKTRLASPHGDI